MAIDTIYWNGTDTVFRNSGDIGPFGTDDSTLETCCCDAACPSDCTSCATTLTATVTCPGASNKVITFTKSGCVWTPTAVLGLTTSNIDCFDASTVNACGHNPSIIRWSFCVTVVPSGPPPFCAANGTVANFYIAVAACPPTGAWTSDTGGWTATLA